jgi:NNP family nitrate/nitrite transporter-like MFS transporter
VNELSLPGAPGEDKKGETASFFSELTPMLFLAFIFFMLFMSRIILSPLMPTIEKELNLTHTEAGSFFLLISTGYFITLLGSGYFSSRLTHRRTIILSITGLGLALMGVSFSHSLWTVSLVLFILGMAGGIYLPSGIATLTTLVSPRHWGKAIAVHEMAPNLSFLAAPLLSEALLGWASWRGILAILGGICVFLGLAFARFGRGGEFPGEAPGLRSSKILMAKPSFWIMIVLFSMGISGTIGIYTMLPLYLIVERGMEQGWANAIVALSRIPGLGAVFLAGWASDRLGPRLMIGLCSLLTGLSTVLLAVAPESWLPLTAFVQATLANCFFPAGFAALSLICPPSLRNLGVSLTIPFAFLIGAGAIPTGIGVMGDAGSFALGIALVGVIICAGCLLSRYLKFADAKESPG